MSKSPQGLLEVKIVYEKIPQGLLEVKKKFYLIFNVFFEKIDQHEGSAPTITSGPVT